jgi:enamine deaminase RidA (YjgF/YER057c/UK114 family)
MALKRIEPGPRMSSAVVFENKVYLAGYTPDAAKGKSVAEQTKDILEQIDETLRAAGTDKTNIIKANIWLTDIKTWAEMNSEWDKWVVAGQTPARATVESALAAPGIDVEIMVEAAIVKRGRSAAKKATARKAAGKTAAKKAPAKATKAPAKKATAKKAVAKKPAKKTAAKKGRR